MLNFIINRMIFTALNVSIALFIGYTAYNFLDTFINFNISAFLMHSFDKINPKLV